MSAPGYYGGPPLPPPSQQQRPLQVGPGFNQPPSQQPGGYGGPHPPPQQGFNQYHHPPPQHFGSQQFPPQQGQYQQPNNFGAPLPQAGFQQYPTQQQAGYARPSPGYDGYIAPGNMQTEVDQLMRAMSGFKRDHTTMIRILSRLDPAQMALLRQTYAQRNACQQLESKIDSSFHSHYGDALLQLVRGPLMADVWNVNRAIKGLGTKENMLNDVLVGRSNADMVAIKQAYQQTFHRSMEQDVKDDLSLKTETMFQIIMRASRTDESYPFNPQEITRDCEQIHYATRGPAASTNQEAVYTILTQRSDNQIRAMASQYQQTYHKSLEDTIRSNFAGHMQDVLLLCIQRASDRAKSDAYQLEAAMKGFGTKDDLLVNRVVALHWNKSHMDQAKRAYQHFFKTDLIQRVRGETSGDYRDCLVACLSN